MFKGRKFLITLLAVFFCGLWVFFVQKLQNKQNLIQRESAELMLGRASESVARYFKSPLKLKDSKVMSPYSFVLKLESETQEPKFFAQNEKIQQDLSPAAIKMFYRSLGAKNKLFVFKDKNNTNQSFMVRVKDQNGFLSLEGMPLSHFQNTLGQAFDKKKWILTDSKNHVLVGNHLTNKRFNVKDLETSYLFEGIKTKGFVAKVYVKKEALFNATLAHIFGLSGIFLIGLSLIGFSSAAEQRRVRRADLDDVVKEEKLNIFDEIDDEEDIQMISLQKGATKASTETAAAIKTTDVVKDKDFAEKVNATARELDAEVATFNKTLSNNELDSPRAPNDKTSSNVAEISKTPRKPRAKQSSGSVNSLFERLSGLSFNKKETKTPPPLPTVAKEKTAAVQSVSSRKRNLAEVKNPVTKKVRKENSNAIDYSDFLMENPILGQTPPALETASSLETSFEKFDGSNVVGNTNKDALNIDIEKFKKDFNLNDETVSIVESDYNDELKFVEGVDLQYEKLKLRTGIANTFIEENRGEGLEPTETNFETMNEKAQTNDGSEALLVSSEDDWLKLAEDLTDSLEEFVQSIDSSVNKFDEDINS